MNIVLKPNVFKIPHRIGLEDKFTSSLAYLFSKYPEVGQAYLDQVCRLGGLRPSTYLGAVDHPQGDSANKPDFLIRGKGIEILFEHKVESELGHSQLERYLKLATSNGQKLCFIANSLLPIPGDVVENSNYIHKSDRDHFVWSDFYDIFKNFKMDLVSEFTEWMEDMGMNPNVWKGHGDPFVDKSAAEEFKKCGFGIKSLIDEKFGTLAGRMVRPGRIRPCLEIRKALPDVHLIYIGLHKKCDFELDENDRVLGLHDNLIEFWVAMRNPNLLKRKEGAIKTPIGTIGYFPLDCTKTDWDKNLYRVRHYLFGISQLLDQNLDVTKANLEFVTLKVFEDISNELSKAK